MMAETRKVWAIATTLIFTLTLAACGGDDGGGTPPPPTAQLIVSGTVQAPAGQVTLFTKPSPWDRAGTLLFPEALAALSGLSPVPDSTPVQLVRIDDAGNVAATLASTSVTGGRYSFNLTSLGLSPVSNLAVRVVNSGTGAHMRAFVTGSTVDLDPISETAIRLVLERIALTPGTEVTPVCWTGREAKIVVERPTHKPGETDGSEAEDTCGGVQSASGGGGNQRGADAE